MNEELPELPQLKDAYRDPTGRTCPFCNSVWNGQGKCTGCHRDPTGRRKPCQKCSKIMPFYEKACCHCGAAKTSDTPKKVIIIVAMFLAAFVLSIILHSIR